ncbi:MAG TPA: DUF1508 domain-containing protein [Mycobacterium sp.]|nr:DUF1508 domain-containing protein [Mycobacterium sp.]
MAAKFEISKDHAGKFRFHLKAPNGETIAASQVTRRRRAAKNPELCQQLSPREVRRGRVVRRHRQRQLLVGTMTENAGASTASCQCGFEGGTRPHADFLDMCVTSPPVWGTRSGRWCPLRAPLGAELQ